MSTTIFDENPYEDHAQLAPLEADVLWEYAKLAQHVRDVRPNLSFDLRDVESGALVDSGDEATC